MLDLSRGLSRRGDMCPRLGTQVSEVGGFNKSPAQYKSARGL
eukprot:COSAG01_NODE_74783_length_200_cov_46.653465_1_plen_41_part_10